MKRIVCIGQAFYNISAVVEKYPEEGEMQRFINKEACGGGSANNIAYMLASWGNQVALSAVIGNDTYGNKIKDELNSLKVDLRYLETTFEKDTIIEYNMVNKTNGVISTSVLSDDFVKLKRYDYDFIPDAIISDGHDYYASKNNILKFPKSLSIANLYHYNNESIELCKISKLLIMSSKFVEKLIGSKFDCTNPQAMAQIYHAVAKKFENKIILIVLEEYGVIYSLNNEIKISPALKVPVVDRSGATDVFASAFIHSYLVDNDLERAIKYGCIAYSMSLSILGIKKSIPTLDNVVKYYEQNYR